MSGQADYGARRSENRKARDHDFRVARGLSQAF
jgi:hypothetical protein